VNGLSEDKQGLAYLIWSWRLREVGSTDLCDSEDLAAAKLDRLIHNALCDLAPDFFLALVDACLELRKTEPDPHKLSKKALEMAYRELKKNGKKPFLRDIKKLAETKYGMPRHSESTLRRICRDMRVARLPIPPRGPDTIARSRK
jgi:hypothetical protein